MIEFILEIVIYGICAIIGLYIGARVITRAILKTIERNKKDGKEEKKTR